MTHGSKLREIPLLDIRGKEPLIAANRYPDGVERLLAAGKRMMTPVLVSLMDRQSERWAKRSGNPYLKEIEAIAARFSAGIWFMNFCFEWGCTTGISEDDKEHTVMRRTLDWPFHGLGRELMVLHQSGPAGDFYNIGWPGFAGVVTGMAPGRFAIAINQAPLRNRGPWPFPIDWILERVEVGNRTALPPVHLARRVLEECTDFDSAVRMVCETKTALPAFFSISGINGNEGTVVEHLGDGATCYPMPQAVANQWLSPNLKGRSRGRKNTERQSLMTHAGTNANQAAFQWLIDPILNKDTRLATVLNAGEGSLHLRGYETDGQASEDFTLDRYQD